ncbi:MAG: hypothetical protein BM564_06355 [Bacteroidetes bacterium MedPE-SWsnd-G2]|nr:MAG: hypothetical protein BM564_06355 [Bacteroidetes bacterium MedPE-SWsnd-G2]
MGQEKKSLISNAQRNADGIIKCAADEYNAHLLKTNPKMMGSTFYEEKNAPLIQQIKADMAQNPNRVLQYTIPVVVHVIHNGEPIGTGANISDAQVISQIDVLNEDYRRMVGTNGWNAHPDGADVEIEFCLAKQTPDGCVTNGIDRIDMSAVSTSWSGPGGNTDSVLKPATYWDASQYMNMWSVNFSDGSLLGFAQFPGGPAESDGVVSNYTYFGSNDAAGVSIPGSFNLGRTMTHEVGHYLGLYHTFQGGCNGSGDFCDDTPATAAPNYGCPSFVDSCSTPSGSFDMVENYMDYTDDACMNLFTNDQKARVINTLATASNRPSTVSSSVCTPLAAVDYDGSLELMDLNQGTGCSSEITPQIRVTNYGDIAMTSALISYDIDGGSSSSFTWNGNLAYAEFEDVDLPTLATSGGDHIVNISISNPNGNTDLRDCNDLISESFSAPSSFPSTTEVNLAITPDNYGSETTWTFSDEDGVLYSGGPYTDGVTTTINETFMVSPNMCYSFTINDGYGDGICCAWGIGSYELTTDDATVIFSGGEFSDSETVTISTLTLGLEDYFVNSGIKVYPNPTSHVLTIGLNNTNDLPTAYEIYNVLGQSMGKKTISNTADLSLNTTDLNTGMYFIRISKDNATVTLPFVKK